MTLDEQITMECLKDTITIKTIKYRLQQESGITVIYFTPNEFGKKIWLDNSLDTTILISQKASGQYTVVCDLKNQRSPRSITNHRELSDVINWYNNIYDDEELLKQQQDLSLRENA
jgi:hypothetical protein